MRANAPIIAACLVVSAATATPITAATPDTAGQALLAQETQRFDAQVAANVPALDHAIADDALYIHANGVAQTKAEYLRDVTAGVSRYRGIEPSERTVTILGTTAVTHGQYVLSVGTDRRILARYTGVYVKRGGRWLVLSWQSTPSGGPARQ